MMATRGSTTTLLALVAITATALIFSTGAVFVDGPTDPITDEVALQPGDNAYTYLDEDGDLVIDVTEDNPNLDAAGVNPDAFVAEEALFYVTSDANETAEVWVEHDSKAVTFVADGEPIESAEEPLLVTPEDEAVPVGVEVDTRIVDVVPGDRLIDEISVHARPAEPESPPDGSEPGDGPSDGSDAGSSPTADPVVSVERPSPNVREVELLSVVGGDETEVELNGLHLGDPAVRLDRLAFVRDSPGDIEFTVHGRATRPADTPAVPPGVDPLGYYEIAFTESDQPIAEATAEIVVDRERLAAAGIDPDRLAVYRETDSGWVAAETTVVSTTDETVRIAADSPGLSVFTVAAERPALDPVETTLSAERVAPGEEFTVDVDLANVGPVPASGATVRVESAEAGSTVSDPIGVDVEPDAATSASVTVRFGETGEYDLVVTGEAVAGEPAAGTVTVTKQIGPRGNSEGDDEADAGEGDGADAVDGGEVDGPEDETGSSGTDDSRSTETSDFGLEDFAGLAALVGIILATLFLIRRAPR